MTRKLVSNVLAVTGLIIALAVTYGGSLIGGHMMIVNVNGLRNIDGVVHVLVYDDADAFAANSITSLATYATIKPSGQDMVVELGRLIPGEYAVMLHHDENADNKVGMSGGIPVEGYGYSNNVGRNETPAFKDAVFRHDETKRPEAIEIVYLR